MTTQFSPTATVALRGDQLLLTFEGHTVTIPFTLKGLTIIKAILGARSAPDKRTIATRGAPTQHMIREWLKKLPTEAKPKSASRKKKLTLEDLGL